MNKIDDHHVNNLPVGSTIRDVPVHINVQRLLLDVYWHHCSVEDIVQIPGCLPVEWRAFGDGFVLFAKPHLKFDEVRNNPGIWRCNLVLTSNNFADDYIEYYRKHWTVHPQEFITRYS